jgi:hypothetical protein
MFVVIIILSAGRLNGAKYKKIGCSLHHFTINIIHQLYYTLKRTSHSYTWYIMFCNCSQSFI